MNNIINLPLDMLKPIIMESELKSLSSKIDKQDPYSIGPYVMSITKLMQQVYSIESIEEMIYFVMEGSDFTEEEAKRYISDILFEQTIMYN